MQAIPVLTKAFDRVRWLERLYGDDIPWAAIQDGFELFGEKILLATKAEGIFKPKQMPRGIISIKTTKPRPGRQNIYEDREVSEGYFRYDLKKGVYDKGSNKNLMAAFEDQTPFIYFHAIAEGRYKAIWPCYIRKVHREAMYCEVVLGDSIPAHADIPNIVVYQNKLEAPVRAYAVRETRVRLHQATFRANVLKAYNHKCALSELPVTPLLEAAHITPDSDSFSSTEISNGIAMSRLHHCAYDRYLIGITPDLDVAVSDRILCEADSDLLKALKNLDGQKLRIPSNPEHQPDKTRLAERYDEYLLLN